jgi:hypothetical protein
VAHAGDEAAAHVGGEAEIGAEHLEGDEALQDRVAGEEDAAHPALAEQAGESIATIDQGPQR